MNNWEKSNLELTPAPDMTILDDSDSLTVLIKHDYYSSDTDHGRILLGAFLDSLAESGSTISKLFVIDTGVKLLNDISFAQKIEKLFSLSKYSYISEESLAFLGIEYVSHANIIVCPVSDIAMEIIDAGQIVTIE